MVPSHIADHVLQTDKNHSRFEKFCCDLFTEVENREFVPTSASWDRGRDARAVGPARGTHAAVICCTLDPDLDAKSNQDLKRLAATSKPDRVIYCSSQKLSEHQLDKVAAGIRGLLPPEAGVATYGSLQLASLAERHPEPFEKHYRAELQNIQAMLSDSAEPSQEVSTRGLRLALMTYGSEDGASLRRALLDRTVLENLDPRVGRTAAALTKRVSDGLHLTRALSVQAVSGTLESLENQTYAQVNSSSGWTATDSGSAALASAPPDAVRTLLDGKLLIEARLTELTGYKFAPDQFARIWSTLLDFLAELFYSNGLGIMESISQLLSTEAVTTDSTEGLRELLKSGAAKIRASTSGLEVGEALEQALLDIFVDRQGKVFEWLSRIAERFVAVCSLGLEASSGSEVRSALVNELLVLDSDILLSYLCEGEPEHRAIRDLLARWRKIGGRVLALTPVLTEVAHHAWISERDFEEMRFLFGKVKGEDVHRYASNAFVRAFLTLAKGPEDLRKWQTYIRQFRGANADDFGPILGIVTSELGAERLPDTFEPKLKNEIANWLVADQKRRGHDPGVRFVDKASRDGQLLATIAAARAAHQKLGDGKTVILLSSSGRLRGADHRFRSQLGLPPAVLARAAFAYLMTLVPDGALGPGSFRQLLFNFGEGSASLSDSDRIAMRVIKATGLYNIPWARRRTLQRQLEDAIHDEAQKLGVKDDIVQKKFEEADEGIRPAEIIASALRGMAVSDNITDELRATKHELAAKQNEVAELQHELNELRTARKRTEKK